MCNSAVLSCVHLRRCYIADTLKVRDCNIHYQIIAYHVFVQPEDEEPVKESAMIVAETEVTQFESQESQNPWLPPGGLLCQGIRGMPKSCTFGASCASPRRPSSKDKQRASTT